MTNIQKNNKENSIYSTTYDEFLTKITSIEKKDPKIRLSIKEIKLLLTESFGVAMQKHMNEIIKNMNKK